jgi:hypothetical protein
MWDLLVDFWSTYGQYADNAGQVMTFGLFCGGLMFAVDRKAKRDEAAGKKEDDSDAIWGILAVSIIAGFFWKYALAGLFFLWLFSTFVKEDTEEKKSGISLKKDGE